MKRLTVAALAVTLATPAAFAITGAELSLNKFGDPWADAGAKANNVPLVEGLGCWRVPMPGVDHHFTPAQVSFLTTFVANYYHEGCATPLEPGYVDGPDISSAQLLTHVNEFKSALPNGQFIGYFEMTTWSLGAIGKGAAIHPDWYLYKADSQHVFPDDIVLTPPPESKRILDITNVDYRTHITQRLKAGLVYYGMDGVLLDGVTNAPPANNLNEVPAIKKTNWKAAWEALVNTLRSTQPTGKLIWVNVPIGQGSFAITLIRHVHGIMQEDSFSPIGEVGGPPSQLLGRIQKQQPVFDEAFEQETLVITTANTKLDGSTYSTATSAIEHQRQKYYLAAFYVFRNNKFLFQFHTPAESSDQYRSMPYFRNWSLNVGGALNAAGTQIAPSVYFRNCSNGKVFLNTTNNPYTTTLNPPLYTEGHVLVTNITVPARSGAIYYTQAAFP